jgi:hypothetical protein
MRLRFLLFGLVLACSGAPASRDGLVVVLWSDGSLGADFDSVRLSVNGTAVDTSKVTELPTSIAVTGKAGTDVVVEARGIKSGLLRVVTVKKTTIPHGHASILDVELTLDCYDRCVQLPTNGTVTTVCDPKAGPGATCTDPPVVAVETLATYENDSLDTYKRPDTCKQLGAYCSTQISPPASCGFVSGPGAMGTLACDSSCRSVDAQTTCTNPALGKNWSMIDGAATGHRRSPEIGPAGTPGAPIAIPLMRGGKSGTPVVSTDGKYAYVTQGSSLAGGAIERVDLEAKTAVLLTMPQAGDVTALYGALDPRTVPGGIKCCDFYGAPLLAADGSLLAVSTSGVLLTYKDPTTLAAPAISWLFKDAVMLSQQGGNFAEMTCMKDAAGCMHGGLVLSPDGIGYFGTFLGLMAIGPDRKPRWGPLGGCESDSAIPSISGDGRITIGRMLPHDGICVVKPDGRARAYEAQDGVFGVVQGSAVGIDGTVFFGTSDYRLHARSDTSAWEVALDGPVLSAPAIGADGTIYIATSFPNPALHAVDRLGRRKWSALLHGGTDVLSSPVVARDGTIYVVNAGGFMTAFSPNGLRAWEVGNGDAFQGSPVLLPNGRIIAMHADRLEIFEVMQ